jgi:hypothetical protein
VLRSCAHISLHSFPDLQQPSSEPLLPHACAMALLPATCMHLAPGGLRHLMQVGARRGPDGHRVLGHSLHVWLSLLAVACCCCSHHCQQLHDRGCPWLPTPHSPTRHLPPCTHSRHTPTPTPLSCRCFQHLTHLNPLTHPPGGLPHLRAVPRLPRVHGHRGRGQQGRQGDGAPGAGHGAGAEEGGGLEPVSWPHMHTGMWRGMCCECCS